MRIQNNYLRNRHFRIKNWKRIRNTEHPFETHMPWFYYNITGNYTTEEQISNHFDWINVRARGLESGFRFCGPIGNNAPSGYRRRTNVRRKAQERVAMQKINNGRYDTELPKFKKDVDWDYW